MLRESWGRGGERGEKRRRHREGIRIATSKVILHLLKTSVDEKMVTFTESAWGPWYLLLIL